jgi:hypothetical protein
LRHRETRKLRGTHESRLECRPASERDLNAKIRRHHEFASRFGDREILSQGGLKKSQRFSGGMQVLPSDGVCAEAITSLIRRLPCSDQRKLPHWRSPIVTNRGTGHATE